MLDRIPGRWNRLAKGRTLLTAARTYYVRTNGSDSNSGLENTAGGAFLTVQKAIDTIAAIDMGPYQVTVQVADGTYTGVIACKGYVGGLAPIIQGNNSTPANVLMSCSADVVTNDGCGIWHFRDMKLVTSSGSLLVAKSGATIYFQGIDFGNCTVNFVLAQANGNVRCTGAFTVSGRNDAQGFKAEASGYVNIASVNITMKPGARASDAFALATRVGILDGQFSVYNYSTCTISIASPGVVTCVGHGMSANEPFCFGTTGALPTGLTAGTTYYVKTVLTADTFTVSATAGGAVINTSGTQSGTHSLKAQGTQYNVTVNGAIYTGGAGAGFFPGNGGGGTSTGGQYA